MKRNLCSFFIFLTVGAGVLTQTGCATTRPKPADPSELSAQVAQLRQETQAKDQQIQDLQAQLAGTQESIQAGPNFSGGGKSKLIRVSGVSVKDLQKALVAAGLDPGPMDGHMGKKTKSAIKAFQKKNSLHADGVVGEKTWNLLKK